MHPESGNSTSLSIAQDFFLQKIVTINEFLETIDFLWDGYSC